MKKNNVKNNLIPIKNSEINSYKQKQGLIKKEKTGKTNIINNKLKDNQAKINLKLTEECQQKKPNTVLDSKDCFNIIKNNQKDLISDRKEEIQALSNLNKELRGRMNSVSLEKGHHSNIAISVPKEININRSYNNSHSTERNNINQSKESSLGKASYERADSIEIEKKNNYVLKNNIKIPLNMNNIHSFNINVITQTVSNQVNNFISTLSSPLNQANSKDNESSSNLITLNSNSSNLSFFNNNLIPVKKKK